MGTMMDPREELFREQFVKPKPGRSLIVGSRVHPGRKDMRKLFDEAIGIDIEAGEGVDLVINLEEPAPIELGKFQHIMCGSVLEHTKRPWSLAAEIQSCLADDATIYVHAPTVWRYHAYPDDYYRFTAAGIAALFQAVDWDVMRYCDHEGNLSEPPKIPKAADGRWGKVQIHAFGHRA